MPAQRIILWRHGRTAWNVDGRLQGQTDIELDPVGHWQARTAAAMLASEQRPTLVISSDLQRALATAREYSAIGGALPVADPALRERSFGQWEGLDRDTIKNQWPHEYAQWHSGNDANGIPPGGETRATCAHRLTTAITYHADGLSDNQSLLVVSHGAAITLALTALLGNDPTNWRGISGLHNAHWSIIDRARPGTHPHWR
ncbi:MAG: histidine phosphatase family protein, partial [Cellulomonadaceae bacterium]|nr:histidine phosphatase family protein [Cellulomonadaceae bacterium]